MKNIEKICIHRYAPELNTIIFKNGVTLKAPNISSIQEIRRMYSKPRNGRYVKITVKNEEHNIMRIYSGYCNTCKSGSYKAIRNFMSDIKNRHNLDGTIFDISMRVI